MEIFRELEKNRVDTTPNPERESEACQLTHHHWIRAMTEPNTTDDLRMIRLQNGDTSAFDELVEEWRRPLLCFFMRNTRDAHLSEDLAQETLLRLYRRAWDYLPTGRLSGYLFRIAHNLLVDHNRSARRDVIRRSVPIRDSGAQGAAVEVEDRRSTSQDAAARQELEVAVGEMLSEIPAPQRQAFTLYYRDGLSLAEVASEMLSEIATTKSRVAAASKRLREKLGRTGHATSIRRPACAGNTAERKRRELA